MPEIPENLRRLARAFRATYLLNVTLAVATNTEGNIKEACDAAEQAFATALAAHGDTVRREMTLEKDQAYLERNHVVAALARLFPSGIRHTNIPDWSEDWHGCVYIDLPSGQISYHYHDSQASLFADLPAFKGEWDGHDKIDVHHRLATIRALNEPDIRDPSQGG